MTTVATQTATILVTDLVGSTELRVRLGEEQAEALRRVHDRLLRDAVEAHGGTVVKGLGDGVLARFDGAADAVAAGVAVQQAADVHTRLHPETPLTIRVGLSAGDVSLEDDDCFGTPVIQASRLCGQAEGGQILAAELVRWLAGGRGGFEFTSLGELELKGLGNPVPTVEVEWTPTVLDGAQNGGGAAVGCGVPLPSLLASTYLVPLVGRADAWQAVKAAWSSASSGDERVVLVAGEPGIGKTRLSTELARRAHEDGGVVLFGGCDEDVEVAYRPFSQALRHLVRYAPTELLASHVASCDGVLLAVVPELGERVPLVPPPSTGDAELDRVRLLDGVLDLLRRTAELAPVLLLLDDLHWADGSTLRLLRHLVRADGDLALLIVATYRDTDVDRSHPLSTMLGDLRRHPRVERVALDGLDEAGIADYLAGAAGHDLGPEVEELAQLMRAETDGNPFFIGEVVRHLVEAGAFVHENGRWQADREVLERLGVPEGVRDVIGRRLSALPEELGDALRAAAVIGAAFDAATLAVVLTRPVDNLLDVLDLATRRGLVIAEPRPGFYRFAHALVRQTLLEETTLGRRLRLHHAVAEALEGSPTADLATIAHHHCEAAVLGDAERAVALAQEVADQAGASLAWEESARWYQRALEADDAAAPAPDRRSGLQLGLGRAVTRTGDAAGGREHFVEAAALARQADRPDLLAHAALGYGGDGAFWVDPFDEVGPALVVEAEKALPPGDDPLRAMLLAKRSHWMMLHPDLDERLEYARTATEMARRLQNDEALTLALYASIDALRGQPVPAERLALADELYDLGLRTRNDTALGRALYGRCHSYAMEGGLDRLETTALELGEVAARARQPLLLWESLAVRASVELCRGRIDEGVRLAEQARATGAPIGPSADFVADFQTGLVVAFYRLDDEAGAEHSEALHDAHPTLMQRGPLYHGLQRLRRGDLEAAAGFARQALAALPASPAMMRTGQLNGLSEIALGVRDPALADELRPLLEPWRGLRLTNTPELIGGPAVWLLARLDIAAGRLDDAVKNLQDALEECRRHDYAAMLPPLLLALAEVLAERWADGDSARIRAALDEAEQAAAPVAPVPAFAARVQALRART